MYKRFILYVYNVAIIVGYTNERIYILRGKNDIFFTRQITEKRDVLHIYKNLKKNTYLHSIIMCKGVKRTIIVVCL